MGTVIGLFASPVTNPHGAVLLFSTHYPELLDGLKRKDNVYLLVRNESFDTEVVKYSDRIGRIENKKSDVVINNVIKGSMLDIQTFRRCVPMFSEHVNELNHGPSIYLTHRLFCSGVEGTAEGA